MNLNDSHYIYIIYIISNYYYNLHHLKEVIEIIALADITDNMTKMGTDLVLQTSEDQKQKAREFLSLSVAVVLGFNIGGGNRRDKLSSGNKIIKLHM